MKDPRLYNMKHRAERDKRLSHPAHRLLAVLISDRYTDRNFLADDEFELPWSTARLWIHLERRQSQEYLKELRARGYLFPTGLKGCPARMFYRFAFTEKDCRPSGAENRATSGAENRATRGAENRATSCAETKAHHISNPFGKNISIKGAAPAAGKAMRRTKDYTEEEWRDFVAKEKRKAGLE